MNAYMLNFMFVAGMTSATGDIAKGVFAFAIMCAASWATGRVVGLIERRHA